MDDLVEAGSNWFCAATHAAGSNALEMQLCGSDGARYGVGVVAVVFVFLLILLTATRLIAGGAERT